MKGAYEQAGKSFRKALELADNTENRFNMGLYYLQSQHYQDAEETFSEIDQEYPDNEINGLLLYESFMLLEKWDKAETQIKKLIKLNPEVQKYRILETVTEDVVAREKYRKVKILKSEAQAFLSEKKYEAALDKYKQAESYSPADTEILNNIGSILLRMKDYVYAYTYFENAFKLEPDNPSIKRNLVQVKAKLRSTRKSL